MSNKNNRMTSVEVAAGIGISDGTLRNWRTEGRGPKFHTLGSKTKRKGKGSRPRVYYMKHEVLAWIKRS